MSLKIEPVLCRAGTMDNYAYIITDTKSGETAVIDPSEAKPIIRRCTELGVKPRYILITHHHYDHVGGNEELKNNFHAKIIGPEAEKHLIPGIDLGVKNGDVFELGSSKAEVISVPGHTLGHILWYFPAEKVLFTGDVLFNLCIGGLFEGTPLMMWESLQKIKALPDDVKFYPGHEYTMQCLNFDQLGNAEPAMVQYAEHAAKRLQEGYPVAPVSLGIEKKVNPYLKIDSLNKFERLF